MSVLFAQDTLGFTPSGNAAENQITFLRPGKLDSHFPSVVSASIVSVIRFEVCKLVISSSNMETLPDIQRRSIVRRRRGICWHARPRMAKRILHRILVRRAVRQQRRHPSILNRRKRRLHHLRVTRKSLDEVKMARQPEHCQPCPRRQSLHVLLHLLLQISLVRAAACSARRSAARSVAPSPEPGCSS